MSFELAGRNCVVAGEFNQAIIKPSWLLSAEIMPDGQVGFSLSDRAGMPRTFNFGGFEWQVAADRFILRTPGALPSPGPVVAKVLRKLPHTPVSGLGHNFLFQREGIEPHLMPCLGKQGPEELARHLQSAEFLETSWSLVLPVRDGFRLTIKTVVEPPKQTIDLNFHFALNDAKAAVSAAERAEECWEKSKDIVTTISQGDL